MNIFVLDLIPKNAAQMHCDKHVVKMITESAQMLNTVNSQYGAQSLIKSDGTNFKRAFPHHPCTKWAAISKANYMWLATLALELCLEYTHRYGKRHSLQTQIELCFTIVDTIPFVTVPLTDFAQAMPDKYRKLGNAVDAYRDYYNNEKLRFAKWTKRESPSWIVA